MGLLMNLISATKTLGIPLAIAKVPRRVASYVEDYIKEHVQYHDVPVFMGGVLTALRIPFPPGEPLPWDSDCMCVRIDLPSPGLQLVWTPGDWSIRAVAVGDTGQVSFVIKDQGVECVVEGTPGPVTYARAAALAEIVSPEHAHLIRPFLPPEAASMLSSGPSHRTLVL